jgi:5-methylcytosine-specific restriction endonuclease McrA
MKKQIRGYFRTNVFKRDAYRCRCCGVAGKDRQRGNLHTKYHPVKDPVELDAHHITPREIMLNGGYVEENGISLCTSCHIQAEDYLHGIMSYYDDFSPENLYKLINSSYEKAVEADAKNSLGKIYQRKF